MATTTDTQPPRKRSRQDVNDAEASGSHSTADTSTPVTRSPDFWYDDGSIVLHAETTQFRVHRSILSQNSTIFRDMFGVPQPNHGEPEVEGCLIVHVSDSAQDIGHMLASLYDRTRSDDMRPSFARVSAMLRLGRKYDIKYQQQEALQILKAELPSTLDGWRNMKPSIGMHIKSEPGLLFEIINLALAMDILVILPAAYLLLSLHYDATHFTKGIPRKDGSHITIPSTAQVACLIGRDKVLKKGIENFYWVPSSTVHPDDTLPPNAEECEDFEACTKACFRLATELWEDPLNPFVYFITVDDLKTFNLLCDDCKPEVRRLHERDCQKMWDMLPTYFGLPSWKEMRR